MGILDTTTNLLGTLRLGEPATFGPLTLLPVFHDGAAADYVLFAQAAAAGDAVVTEVGGGSVPELTVENRGDADVLLVEGEVLVGMRQNRTLNTTVLVPARSTLVIPVACVERGRWAHRTDTATPDAFHLSPEVRRAKSEAVQRSVRVSGHYRTDQGAVWDGVAERLHRHGIDSHTDSYSDLHRSRGTGIADGLRRLRPVAGQHGVLAMIGGRPAALDIFDRPDTLAALWDGLVGSYLADALVAPDVGADPARARAWVDQIAGAGATTHRAVGKGDGVQLGCDAGVASALVVDGAVVHLAALASAALPPDPAPRTWFHQRSRTQGGA